MRKLAPKLLTLLSLALATAFVTPMRALADEEDPPTRVARLSHTDGNVSFNPAGTDDWVSAVINRPMTTGDKLWSDDGGRAELHIGSASLRIGGTTGFNFLNLTDNLTQIQVTEGTVRVRVKRLEQDETFEIDTPNLAFSVLRPGIYRVSVNEAGDTTVVSVLGGEGEVTGGGQAYSVHANQTATFVGTDQLDADVQDFAGGDDFDQWCADRDRREDRSTSARYVSPDVIGYEDLDDYGGWRPVPEYGSVWFPHTTVVGWAPYRYGHWVYIAPWGYTWVEDEPWGFAPFHYGRWVTVGGVWGWVPAPAPVVGVVYVRPVYAPALVAWVGGPHFGVGVGVNVGWFPLGPREVYVPSYPVSRRYVTNINVTNTRVETTVVNNYYTNVVVNKQVNVTNVTYVNQRVNGAVTATSGASFTSGQSVSRNVVRVDQREVVSTQIAAPAIAPTRQAFVGSGAPSNMRPPERFANRAVVAKSTPPPPPPSFERQQAAIRENGGRPLAVTQYHQLQPANAQASARMNVKIAPATRTVTAIPPHNDVVKRTNGNVTGANERPANTAGTVPGNVPPNANNHPANVPGNVPPNANNHPANVPGNVPPNANNHPANVPGNVPPNANNHPANVPGNVPPNANNHPANVPGNVPPNANNHPANVPGNVPPNANNHPANVPGNVPPNANNHPANVPGNVPPNANNHPANVPGNVPPNANNHPANVPGNVPPNANDRPANVPGNVPPNANNHPANVPNNVPGNVPANNNQRAYSDRPAASRPATTNPPVNAQLEQQHQQQLENLRKQQDVERQKVEQQQVKEQQRVQAVNDQQKQAQVQQKQQQQLEQMEKKHDTQQQQLQQKQVNEKAAAKGGKPEKENKPPKNDHPNR